MTYSRRLKRQQRGAVLAVILIILLVLTVVGVTTMNTSSIQTFIARNTQFKQISFQNAESTVNAAELAWNDVIDTCLNDVANCPTNSTPPIITHIDSIDWDTVDGSGVTPHGKYVVEYLGWRPVLGESNKQVHLYRITARGLGPNTQAATYVQTVFRKCVKRDGVACPNT